jgi:D-serine deaminase-like pyridoxal phosphate-dependent protein
MNTDQFKCCQLQDTQINALHSLAFLILKKSRKCVIIGSGVQIVCSVLANH